MCRGKTRTLRQRHAGFSLIELLIVISIIGIIATVAVPILLTARQRAMDEMARASVRSVLSAQQTFFVSHSRFGDFPELAGTSPPLLDVRFDAAEPDMGHGIVLSMTLEGDFQGFDLLAVNPSGNHNYSATETMLVVEE